MTERKLKDAWRTTAGHLRSDSSDAYATVNLGGKTTLDRLASRYRRFSIIAIVVGVLLASWNFNPVFDDMPHRLAIVAYGLVFFVVASLVDYRLYLIVRSIDPARMSVESVIRRCLHARKRHLQSIAFLMPMALGFLGFLGYSMSFDTYFLAGMVSGGIIGLGIGIKMLMDFMSDYRSLTSLD